MKKNTVLYAALAGLLLSTGAAFAQQGMGTNNPDASSVLDMQSSERGLLIPRVKLEATNLATPVSSPANSLLVYNTKTTTGTNKVTPGYYYWDVNKWQRVVNVQEATDIAIANDNDTKVSTFSINTANGLQLTFTDGTSKSVSIAELKAAIDTNTTYSGSNSVVLSGTTFKRAALTGDVNASEDSNTVTVTKIQGKAVATTAPNSGQVLSWNGSAWAPTDPALTAEVDGIIGNEVTDVIADRGLERTGTGTASDPYKVGLTAGTANGQVMKWNGTKWAPAADADTSSKVTGATLSASNVLTLSQDGGASDVTVNLSSLATDIKLSSASFDNSSSVLTLTKSDNSTVTVNLSALATDTNTQSRETVEAGAGITVTATGNAGDDNRKFTVGITPAGASEDKILASENGTVKWIDKPTTSSYVGPNFGNGEIRSVNHITTAEWDNNQFALIQTGQNQIQLPPANTTNKNRIIAVHNDTSSGLNYASPSPNRNSMVQAGKGQLLMCDGSKWVVIGGL